MMVCNVTMCYGVWCWNAMRAVVDGKRLCVLLCAVRKLCVLLCDVRKLCMHLCEAIMPCVLL